MYLYIWNDMWHRSLLSLFVVFFKPPFLFDYGHRGPKAWGIVWGKFVFAGELFAQAPVSQYPGSVVESVTDSSRYFVIRIEDGNGEAHLSTHTFVFVSLSLPPLEIQLPVML